MDAVITIEKVYSNLKWILNLLKVNFQIIILAKGSLGQFQYSIDVFVISFIMSNTQRVLDERYTHSLSHTRAHTHTHACTQTRTHARCLNIVQYYHELLIKFQYSNLKFYLIFHDNLL